MILVHYHYIQLAMHAKISLSSRSVQETCDTEVQVGTCKT